LQRNVATFLLGDQYKEIKQKMLNWANQFSIFLLLDSNNYDLNHSEYEYLLAVHTTTQPPVIIAENSLLALQELHNTHKDWMFGHICYDYKSLLEQRLNSNHLANHSFPLLYFFVPSIVCYIKKGETTLHIESLEDTPKQIFEAILANDTQTNASIPSLDFTQRINKEVYLERISKLRTHIADGDCYEINLCNEGYCEHATVDPKAIFEALNTLSPAPFAAFYRHYNNYMMCSSPERYLRKKGNTILSQPIKGTAKRNANDEKDEEIKTVLKNDIKERAENVMIVDLTRNDIARSCETGSVTVEELFGIYTFPQVHQMISTISGQLKKGTPFTDAIRYSFPMGSMTGAPKIKVMELIEQYEASMRELFSGTVGYITPGGDFDFNVIIRSLFYNANTRYLSYQTGGAITYDSDPEKEWEEMRLKAWALERIFQ